MLRKNCFTCDYFSLWVISLVFHALHLIFRADTLYCPFLNSGRQAMSQLVEFAGNHPFWVVSFLVVLSLFLYSLYKEQSKAYQNVSVDQLTRLVNQQNAQVIDVRSKEEFDQGHIVNAVNLPMDEITSGKAKFDKLKKKPVVVYCQIGKISLAASQQLTDAGFEQVFNLKGGINAWLSDKLPLSKV